MNRETASVSSGSRRTEVTDTSVTLMTIWGLLNAAAGGVQREDAMRPPLASRPLLSLGLLLAACQAAELLPEDYLSDPRSGLDELLPSDLGDRAPLQLLHQAEELTRAHDVDEFPPGISGLVVSLIDLIRDWTP